MKIDPTKSAVENLLALIDASNPDAPNLPDEVTVSNLTTGSYPNSGDTQITLTGTGPQGSDANFGGSVNVTYKRLTLAAEMASPTGSVPLPAKATAAASLLAVENYFGFIPGELSWVTPPTYPSGGGAGTGTIQASSSLVYEDGQATVNLNWASQHTAALMHFDGANNAQTFVDEAGHATGVQGGAALTTTQSKFGGSSYNSGNSNAYPYLSDNTDFHFAGDFTIECWIYSTVTKDALIVDKSNGAGASASARAWVELDNGQLFVKTDTTSSASALGSGSPFTNNVWHHLAVVKSGTTITGYCDGVATGSVTDSNSWGNNPGYIAIGDNVKNNGTEFDGYIDELRFSNIARYTGNFTPPTAAFVLD